MSAKAIFMMITAICLLWGGSAYCMSITLKHRKFN